MTWTLEQWLEQWSQAQIVFVGVGHYLRGDDAAGPLLAQELSARGVAHVIDAGPCPERALPAIVRTSPEVTLFMDAADFGAPPGAYAVFDGESVAARRAGSGWGGLNLALHALREQLARPAFVLGIQPLALHLGTCPSSAIKEAVSEIALQINWYSQNNLGNSADCGYNKGEIEYG